MLIVQVPELEALMAGSASTPALLERLFRRARRYPLNPSTASSELICGQPLPAAAVSRQLDYPHDCEGIWLRADPVQLRPDLNAVWVRPSRFPESDHPAVSELAALFSETGFAFDLPVPTRGYLRLSADVDCRFVPPWMLAGQSLDHLLPDGPDGAIFTRLLTEAQVVLHQYAESDLPSGLWFWGAGALPSRSSISPRVSHVAGDDPELPALAKWLDLSYQPGPARQADQSFVRWQPGEGTTADQALIELADWLKPAWCRLWLGRLDRLELAGAEQVWGLGSGQARAFWRGS